MSRVRVALDFNCSPRLVEALQALYGHHGFEFLHLQSLVPGRTKDEIWADAYRQFGGRALVSGDGKIAYRPREAVAFIDNGFISLFPERDWCQMPANARSAVLIYSWPRIAGKIAEGLEGSCWRIPCRGTHEELKLDNKPLERLNIPEDVLDRARSGRTQTQSSR